MSRTAIKPAVDSAASMHVPESAARKAPTVNSVVHALAILRFLARSGEAHGITAIAKAVGINPSSAFNIAKTLTAENFLTFDPDRRRYELGRGATELAGVAMDHEKAFQRVRDELAELATRFSVTTAFWRLTDDERLGLVGLVDSNAMMRIQMTVGQRIPAYSGAMGRCFAAHRGLAQDALKRHFDAVRWQQKPDFSAYTEELSVVQRQHWAVDLGQFIRGVMTVASPITDPQGRIRYFIANSSFVGQLDDRSIRSLGTNTRKAALAAAKLLFA